MPPRGTTTIPRGAAVAAAPAAPLNPNGFSPDLWGPSMWFMVHLIAATFPEAPTPADKANYMAFYRALQFVLPCPGCAKGYQTIITSGLTPSAIETAYGPQFSRRMFSGLTKIIERKS